MLLSCFGFRSGFGCLFGLSIRSGFRFSFGFSIRPGFGLILGFRFRLRVRSGSGSHFDPAIVNAFVNAEPQVREAMNLNLDA
jgi:hypothetical protein